MQYGVMNHVSMVAEAPGTIAIFQLVPIDEIFRARRPDLRDRRDAEQRAGPEGAIAAAIAGAGFRRGHCPASFRKHHRVMPRSSWPGPDPASKETDRLLLWS